MHAERRAQHAEAGLAAGKDEHAGAGAIGGFDAARGIGDADRRRQPARADDLAHDRGLIQIAARRGQQDHVAGGEMRLVQLVAEPVRRGGADRAADEQRAPAARRRRRGRAWRSPRMSGSARHTGLSSSPRHRAATGPGRRECRRRKTSSTKMRNRPIRRPVAARRGPAAAGGRSTGGRGGATEGPVGDLRKAIFSVLIIIDRQSILTPRKPREARPALNPYGAVTI